MDCESVNARLAEKNWDAVKPGESQRYADDLLSGERQGVLPRVVARFSEQPGSDFVSMEVFSPTSSYDLLFPRWTEDQVLNFDVDKGDPELDRQVRILLAEIGLKYGHPSDGPIDDALLTDYELERIHTLIGPGAQRKNSWDAETSPPRSPDASRSYDDVNEGEQQDEPRDEPDLQEGIVTGQTVHMCERCGNRFSSAIKLNRHLQKIHGLKTSIVFVCTECQKKFTNNFTLKRHMQTAHGQRPEIESKGFACSECTSSFTERKTLYVHMREKHDVEPNITTSTSLKPKEECHYCGKVFTSISNLNRHKKNVHRVASGEEGKLQCPLCTERFVSCQQIDNHLQSNHEIMQETELLFFSRLEDFNTWKEGREETTLSCYVKKSGTKSVQRGQRSYFYCHRSGASRCKTDADKERIKWQSSGKIGSHCTSQIIVTELHSQEFQVTYSKVHVGHDVGLQYLRLTRGQRIGLAERIRRKENLNVILDDIRDSVSEETDMSRVHLLERKDLLNIIRDFNLDDSKANKNDADSVDFWINEQEKLGHQSAVIYYKPQHKSKPGCNLEEKDAMVAIMTPYQQEVLTSYTGDKILVDSTHGTTEYDFQLTTLMTVDEYGAGCAVAFCISNRTDEVAMSEFFIAVKIKVGAIEAKIFMSDDSSSYYNAWESVMGPCLHRLLCTWHVDKAWRTQAKNKIKNVEKAAQVYKGCRVLLEETDAPYFKRLMSGFLTMLGNDPDTVEFGQYFQKYYGGRAEVWAFCFRRRLGLNTNMYLEALHKKFKYIYLEGRKNRRVDRCITYLLKFIRDMMFERLIRLTKNKPTKRMLAITASHKRSKEIRSDMIEEINTNRWEVKSSSTDDVYVVQKIDKDCVCALQCPLCKVCIHQFFCDCPDNLIRLNLCKHIHACVSRNPQSINQLPSTTVLQESNISIMKSQVPHLLPIGSIVTTQTKLESLCAKVQALAQDIPAEDEEEACKGVERLLNHFEKLISKSQQTPLPTTPVTPANKKIERQNRFSSTKKKRSTIPQRTFAKPGTMQKALMQYLFIEDENSTGEEELMVVQSQGDLDHIY